MSLFSKPASLLFAPVAIATFLPPAEATVIYSDTFDNSPLDASLDSPEGGYYFRDGVGSSRIVSQYGLGGSQAVELIPSLSVADVTFVYRNDTLWSGDSLAAEPVITFSADLLIASPTTGTANRTVSHSLMAFNSAVNPIAAMTVWWDGENIFGGGSDAFYLFCDAHPGSPDFNFDGQFHFLGRAASDKLTDFGYQNVKIELNYQLNTTRFFLNGLLLEQSGRSAYPMYFSDFSDADFLFQNYTPEGTLPRLFADNYTITASPIPEPTSLATLSPACLALLRRRRNPSIRNHPSM